MQCRLLILLALILLPLLGRAQVTVGRPERMGEETDCRVSEADLQPVVAPDNPYFYNHTWDAGLNFETARLDEHRQLEVELRGCLRLHTVHRLYLDKEIIEFGDLSFYAIEVFNLMNRIYFNSPKYWTIKPQFEQAFIKRFPAAGLDNQFNFQIAEYTFICEVLEDPAGALIKIEQVQLLHEGGVKWPGIPHYNDDGWFKPAK